MFFHVSTPLMGIAAGLALNKVIALYVDTFYEIHIIHIREIIVTEINVIKAVFVSNFFANYRIQL